jgi:hypothetical protein
MGYMSQFFNMIPQSYAGFAQPLVVRENTGILVKQNAVASVGSISVLIAFTTE